MHLLVDSDSLLYKAGFVVNGEGQEALACYQLDTIIENILSHVTPDSSQFFISGANNFRYSVYPEYKGNRVNTARPLHLGVLREHIVRSWGATVSDGIEADDAVSIAQCSSEDTCVAHIDKDLNLIPGRHFNYNTYEYYDVSEVEAFRNFYMQLIQGDKGDNIPGYDGKMRPKLPKFLYPVRDALQDMQQPEEMLDLVLGYYQEDLEKLDRSARCLWLLREEHDDWIEWLDQNIMAELGRSDVLTVLLQARSAPQAVGGRLNSNA